MAETCLADVTQLRAHPELFGSVAFDPTVSRCIDILAKDAHAGLAAIHAAHAAARRTAWALAGEDVPDFSTEAAAPQGHRVDATLVAAQSEKDPDRHEVRIPDPALLAARCTRVNPADEAVQGSVPFRGGETLLHPCRFDQLNAVDRTEGSTNSISSWRLVYELRASCARPNSPAADFRPLGESSSSPCTDVTGGEGAPELVVPAKPARRQEATPSRLEMAASASAGRALKSPSTILGLAIICSTTTLTRENREGTSDSSPSKSMRPGCTALLPTTRTTSIAR